VIGELNYLYFTVVLITQKLGGRSENSKSVHFALAKLALDTVGGIDTRSPENVPIDRGNQPENISVARSDHRVQINRSDGLSKILFGLYYEVSPVQSNR
jgi:hypothetical protein